MLRRIKNGWALTKKSWAVLKENPGLLRFPVIGAIVAIVVSIVTFVPGIALIAIDETAAVVTGVVVLVIGALLLAFTVVFFAVALAHNADRLLAGEQPGFGDGISLARQRSGPIFAWAIISTTVGVLIQALQERFGLAGAILGGLAGAAWGILTFLAIPVIAIEGTGGFSTVKRCTQLIRSRWGEQITGTIAIGGILFLIGFLPAALVIGGGVALIAGPGVVAAGVPLILVGALYLAVVAVVNKALVTIFGVALYHYAAEERAVGDFTIEELAGAVRAKGSMPPGTAGTTI
jgi:hypothetical protein